MSDVSDELKRNLGITTVGDAGVLSSSERTYVVLGVSRGGTSAIAGWLNILGVPMGRSGKPPLFEDLRMNRALAAGIEAAEQQIAENNAEQPVWGFKGNAIQQPYGEIARRLRNPVFVVIFRDLLAIANRARLSASRDVGWILQKQAQEYARIADFVATGGYYSVLLSFEKLNACTEDVLAQFSAALALPMDEAVRERALQFIRPAPEDYLRVSKAKKRD
ncbi:hypothetical protein [Haliea sp. E17]|uniref:hypothetical protein n=1 Tax=Haliea sp. E17 TaxID=3401576 RepID=UPI003AADF712